MIANRSSNSEDEGEYAGGYSYDFSFEDILGSQFFGPDLENLFRRTRAQREAKWREEEAIRMKYWEEKQVREEETETIRQARANAKVRLELEKQQAKEMRTQLERSLQEKRWSDMNATTEEEKRQACLHSEFWPKEQQKRKFRCQSCGKKGGMTAYKCPYCSLLACQVCLGKLAKRKI